MTIIDNKWYIYLLKCSDNSIYTGISNNLDKRIKDHNAGRGAKYTKGRLPVTLIKSFEVLGKSKALKIEYHIKSLKQDKKLEFSLEDYLENK